MSEQDLADRLDRVAAGTPPMDVSLDDVIGEARGRQRRRRVAGVGMGLSTLALAGAVWWGLGEGGLLGGGEDTSPAGTSGPLSVDGVGDGDALLAMTGDTVTAGDLTFRIEQRDGTLALTQDGGVLTWLNHSALQRGPVRTAESGPGVVVALVPPGQEPSDVRVGRIDEGAALTWEEPQSVVRVDLVGGRSFLVAGVADTELAPFDMSDPTRLLGVQRADGVEALPVVVFGEGEIDVWRGVDGYAVTEGDGRLDGVVSQDGVMTSYAGIGGTAVVFAEEGGLPGQVWPVVRDLGRVRNGDFEGSGLAVGSESSPTSAPAVFAIAPAGVDVLGGVLVGNSGDAADRAWLGSGSVTTESQLGPVLVAPEAGAWSLRPADGSMTAVVGGVGEALVPVAREEGLGGEVLDAHDPRLFDLMAAFPASAMAEDGAGLVTAAEVRLLGEEHVMVPGEDVAFYSATVEVPEGGSLAYAVRGLDADGDGSVDLPLVTDNRHWDLRPDGDVVTLLGEPYLITGVTGAITGSAGDGVAPVLEHLDEPGQRLELPAFGPGQGEIPAAGPARLSVTGQRFDWEGEGLVVAVPGWRPTESQMVGFTSTDPRHWHPDQPQGWLAPWDLVVVDTEAGPVTLATLPPQLAAVAGELSVDVEGVARPVAEVVGDPGGEGSSGSPEGAGSEEGGDVAAWSEFAEWSEERDLLEQIEVGSDLVPVVDGAALQDTGTDLGGGARLYALDRPGTEEDRGVLVVPGYAAADVVLPLEETSGSRDLGRGLVLGQKGMALGDQSFLVQVLAGEVLPGEDGPRSFSLVTLDADKVAAGDREPWSVVEGSGEASGPEDEATGTTYPTRGASVELPGRLQAVVSVERGLWLVGRTGLATMPQGPLAGHGLAVAGTVGEAADWLLRDDGTTLDVVTVTQRHQAAAVVTARGAEVVSSEVVPFVDGDQVGDTELVVHHVVVSIPGELAPADYVPGFDLDGDGEADLSLAFKG